MSSSTERNSSTPSPQIVTIISYSQQQGPLHPSPHRIYDLRDMPSPTRELRDSCDGRDERLRSFLMEFPTFVALLNRACEEIIELAQSGTKQRQDEPTIARSTAKLEANANRGDDEIVITAGDQECKASPLRDSVSVSPQAAELKASGAKEGEATGEKEVRVGVFCVRGQHRSAAFAEQLARMEWPRTWDIRVQHRDIARD